MHHPKIPQWYQVLKFENNFYVCMCDANIQDLYMYNSMEFNEGKCDMHIYASNGITNKYHETDTAVWDKPLPCKSSSIII